MNTNRKFKIFFLIMTLSCLSYASMFFMDRKKIDKELIRSNPADPGSKNYQGYKTLTNTQAVYILNAASVSNGETRVVLLSNTGWLPQKYMASTNINFLESSWSNMTSDRRFSLTLPDITGWHAIFVKFSLPDGTTTETSNAVYYRNTNTSLVGIVGTTVWADAVFYEGIYYTSLGETNHFTNGLLNSYGKYYYNASTGIVTISNMAGDTLLNRMYGMTSHGGNYLYFYIVKKISGPQGSMVGIHDSGPGSTLTMEYAEDGSLFTNNVKLIGCTWEVNNNQLIYKTPSGTAGTSVTWVRSGDNTFFVEEPKKYYKKQ